LRNSLTDEIRLPVSGPTIQRQGKSWLIDGLSHNRYYANQRRIAMSGFLTARLSVKAFETAPDGSDARILLGLERGGMAHFELGPGETSVAVAHHTVEEIWFFLSGRGEFWRKLGDQEEVVPVDPGVCITIPVGTHFQFRSFGYAPLAALVVTMPPWPGEGEVYFVEGKWGATVESESVIW
jgi:mannose-6-phosphate isomerase-like protein (cupin superfamily)